MQELSLNILDIAQNSVHAGAGLIRLTVSKQTKTGWLSIMIEDNGCGMDESQLKSVTDPFYTTRTTRKVGLGVPFFKMTAEMTGGTFEISSKPNEGTLVTARYRYEHLDMLPLGDIPSTIVTLIQGSPEIDFVYTYEVDDKSFTLDTREVKRVLEEADIASSEVLAFLKDMIKEGCGEIDNAVSA